jgi:glycosyltransferase involved in cell wall biosynthesis
MNRQLLQKKFFLISVFAFSLFNLIHAAEKKRLLIICDNFESVDTKIIGGTEHVLIEATKYLEANNFEVSFVKTSNFDIPRGMLSLEPTNAVKQIDTIRPDYILIVLHGFMSYHAACYCADNDIPFTAFHSCRLEHVAAKTHHIPTWLSKHYVNKFLKRAARVLVPTQSFVDELHAEGIKQASAWPHGVDLNQFSVPTADEKATAITACGLEGKPRPFYLCVSRISQEKNIEAFLKLDVPGTKILVGPADNGYSIESLRKNYPDAIIAGPKKGRDLINYYKLADAFVFPSMRDVYGLTQLEALASGLPIIGFNTYGPQDVVPKGCGVSYLAEVETGQAGLNACAAEAWADLKADTQGAIPARCRAYVERFSWEAVMRPLMENLIQINPDWLPDLDVENAGGICCGSRHR